MNQEPTLKPIGHGGGKQYLVPYRFGRFKIVGVTRFGVDQKRWYVISANEEDRTEYGVFETLEDGVEFARSLWQAEMKL